MIKIRRESLKLPILTNKIGIDSQSVKIAPRIVQEKEIDGNKKVNGRKKLLIVDELGLIYGFAVTADNVADYIGGLEILHPLDKNKIPIQTMVGDHAFSKQFVDSAKIYSITFEPRKAHSNGFIPSDYGWQVESTFSWTNFYRRLNKDYEKTIESHIYLLQIMTIILSLISKRIFTGCIMLTPTSLFVDLIYHRLVSIKNRLNII